jgi:hypothetical protein
MAQRDGPNMWPLAPKGMTVINPIYINLRSNVTASQDFVSAKGLMNINVVPLLTWLVETQNVYS